MQKLILIRYLKISSIRWVDVTLSWHKLWLTDFREFVYNVITAFSPPFIYDFTFMKHCYLCRVNIYPHPLMIK